jgi:hypothetical protein
VALALCPSTHQSNCINSGEIIVQTAVGIIAVILVISDDLESDRVIGIPRDVQFFVFLAEIK